MQHQVLGLGLALSGQYEHQAVQLKFPWRWMLPTLIPAAPWAFREPSLFRADTPPAIALSCGRQGMVAALTWKRLLGERVFTVHIQDPKVPPSWFDMVVVPEHDDLRGPNVVVTKGAIHHISKAKLVEAARNLSPDHPLRSRKQPSVAVLLGGESKHHTFTEHDADHLIHKLRRIVLAHRAGLVILPSRRTPQGVVNRILREFGDSPDHFIWTGQCENPYIAALAVCSHVVVTSDSVSMASEATATGKPVFIEHITSRRNARRIERFHETFEIAGMTRPFAGELSDWSYPTLDEARRVAQIIQQLRGTDVSSPRSPILQRAA